MSTDQTELFQGKKVEILEMILKNVNNQLELSCKINFQDAIFTIIFYNVSRFRIENLSTPLVVHGFEIINHFQNGWDADSKYEIRDFEYDRVHFFCECYENKTEGGEERQ